MTNLVDRCAYLDALDDFFLDSDEWAELADGALAAEEMGVDLEEFLRIACPELLAEFEGQYEKHWKESQIWGIDGSGRTRIDGEDPGRML